MADPNASDPLRKWRQLGRQLHSKARRQERMLEDTKEDGDLRTTWWKGKDYQEGSRCAITSGLALQESGAPRYGKDFFLVGLGVTQLGGSTDPKKFSKHRSNGTCSEPTVILPWDGEWHFPGQPERASQPDFSPPLPKQRDAIPLDPSAFP